MELFKKDVGVHSLGRFGSGSYKGKLSHIMFDYYRSFLTVEYLVEIVAKGDVFAVFEEYHQWDREGRKVPLTEFFNVDELFG